MKGFKQSAKMSHGGHYCWGGKVMKKAEGGGVSIPSGPGRLRPPMPVTIAPTIRGQRDNKPILPPTKTPTPKFGPKIGPGHPLFDPIPKPPRPVPTPFYKSGGKVMAGTDSDGRKHQRIERAKYAKGGAVKSAANKLMTDKKPSSMMAKKTITASKVIASKSPVKKTATQKTKSISEKTKVASTNPVMMKKTGGKISALKKYAVGGVATTTKNTPTVGVPKSIAPPTKIIPQKTVDLSRRAVVTSPKAVATPPKAVATPPKAVATPPKASSSPPPKVPASGTSTPTKKTFTGKPSMKEFMDATGVDSKTASEALYGVAGSNKDSRQWASIMASKNPLAELKKETAKMYSDPNQELPESQKKLPPPVARSGNFGIIENTDPKTGEKSYSYALMAANGMRLRTYQDPKQAKAAAEQFGFDPSQIDKLDVKKIASERAPQKPKEVKAPTPAATTPAPAATTPAPAATTPAPAATTPAPAATTPAPAATTPAPGAAPSMAASPVASGIASNISASPTTTSARPTAAADGKPSISYAYNPVTAARRLGAAVLGQQLKKGGKVMKGAAKGGKWIQGAIKKPGSLHKSLGVPMGQKIPAGKLEKASHAAGKLGKRARLAMTLKGMK